MTETLTADGGGISAIGSGYAGNYGSMDAYDDGF
jgi:hypothetical protein